MKKILEYTYGNWLILALAFLLANSCTLEQLLGLDDPKDSSEVVDDFPFVELWSYEFSEKDWFHGTPPVIVGDSLVLTSGDEYLTCLRLVDGSLKWQYAAPGGYLSDMKNILFNDTQVFFWNRRPSQSLQALDIESGALLWSLDSVAGSRFHALSSTHYYSTYGNKYFKISLDGTVVDTVNSDHSFRGLATHNGKVFGSQGWWPGNKPHDIGRVICYDEETLDSLWSYETSGGGFNMCQPTFEDNILYTGTVWGDAPSVIALDIEDGSLQWKNDSYFCYQTVLRGDTLYWMGGAYALDRHTGEEIWTTNINVHTEGDNFIYYEGYLYFARYCGLHVLDAESGEIVQTIGDCRLETIAAGNGVLLYQRSTELIALEPFDEDSF